MAPLPMSEGHRNSTRSKPSFSRIHPAGQNDGDPPPDYTSRIGPAQISQLLGQHVASLQVGRQKNVRLSGNRRMDAFDESSFFADIVVLGEGDRGRVTEIGLRSTRIKRLDGILVSIPTPV